MKKRKCFNCGQYIPPETEHFDIDNEVYCTDCIDVEPYTSYQYYLNGEYVGNSEEGNVQHIEDYEDDYDEE